MITLKCTYEYMKKKVPRALEFLSVHVITHTLYIWRKFHQKVYPHWLYLKKKLKIPTWHRRPNLIVGQLPLARLGCLLANLAGGGQTLLQLARSSRKWPKLVTQLDLAASQLPPIESGWPPTRFGVTTHFSRSGATKKYEGYKK